MNKNKYKNLYVLPIDFLACVWYNISEPSGLSGAKNKADKPPF
jgi:hypothetical protein